tara:strand:- start:875 stop:1642 length:768 start_codon:yes stop_codon:yes gene_type:complete
MPSNKKYSLNEVKSIIKVASQLQSNHSENKEEEFSIADILEIAETSGISLQKIEAAIQFLESEENDYLTHKTDTIFSHERLIEHQVTPEVWERIVRECRTNFDDLGQTNHFGNTLEWFGKTKNKTAVHISISSGKEISRLKIHVDYSSISTKIKIIASLAGFISFAIISSMLNLDSISNFVPLVLNLTGAGFGYLSSSFFIKRYLKKKSNFYTTFIDNTSKLISTKFEKKISINEDTSVEDEDTILNKGHNRARV